MIIDGIDVRIDRKKIKNMHLYVKPPDGTVSVSAPMRMSNIAIERFVRSKITWVKKQQEHFVQQPRQAPRQYVSGETLYLWGKQYFLQVDYGNRYSLTLSGNAATLTVRPNSTTAQRENFVREWYRELLKEEITRTLPKWETATGLKCNSWHTKYMTSKWGTCNISKRKIWLNLQLAQKPMECLEYIILHELAHLKVRNHNAAFAALLDKHMPFWREVKKRLNGQTLDSWEGTESREDEQVGQTGA
ncbi:MAG: M48 family metallopeptidase [Chitinispirillales bacterium]|jgi:predicted metal-dependent hydrolase|nr:M48 family metallopeptidase [Chitinispirillales bacterium]